MKIFSWIHQTLHRNLETTTYLDSQRKAVTETKMKKTCTDALNDSIALDNVLDNILKIGTFGHAPLITCNKQNKHIVNGEIEECWVSRDDEVRELKPIQEIEDVPNQDMITITPQNISRVDIPIESFKLRTIVAKDNSEENKYKKRTTLADLFSVDDPDFSVMKKSSSPGNKGSVAFERAKQVPLPYTKQKLVGESFRPYRKKVQRLITGILRKKIHPKLEEETPHETRGEIHPKLEEETPHETSGGKDEEINMKG